jgi:hypothetical protein
MESVTKTPKSPIVLLLDRFLPGLKYPYLFLILGGLLVADLVLPDPIPLFDELGLAILTLLVGAWRTRREPDLPPRDVTPTEENPPQLPSD